MTDFVELMDAAIASTDGTEQEAFAMFELRLMEHRDPQLVWELFEPVRTTVLRRLYGMAKYQSERNSEAESRVGQTSSAEHIGADSVETVDSPTRNTSTRSADRRSTVSDFDGRRTIRPSVRSRSPRGIHSAQDVIMSIGGKKSHLDWITNHRGLPIGDLTYYGLANCSDESPIVARYARRLMESGIPKSGRQSDVVRRFITPEEADRIWLDLLKEVA